MAETDQETTLFVNDSGQPGSTAYIVGGIHGDEEAGYPAADGIADRLPDAGTLVVLPRANSDAIDRDRREGPNGDLDPHVDGTSVTVADLNPDRIRELRVEGTGPTVRFDVDVSGATYPTATLEDSDTVYDSRIEGQVSILADRYLFEGDITSFDVTYGSNDDIAVYVDGEQRSITTLNG